MFWLIVIVIIVGVVVFIGFTIASHTIYRVTGNQKYDFDIVGEASYQENLKKIAGEKQELSKRIKCIAIISLDPTNPHDKNAVKVTINQKTVGYFDRDKAMKFNLYLKEKGMSSISLLVDAMIVGGWVDGKSEGHYGVKLDVPFDFYQWQLNKIEK